MTTRVDITGEFLIPTNSPMNGPVLTDRSTGDYESIREIEGGISVPMMAGVIAAYPDVHTLIARDAVAYRVGDGWEIYLTAAGVRLTTDIEMSEGSISQGEMVEESGLATLYESGDGVPVPAFWMGFKNSAEDDFAGGAGGWVPDDPPSPDDLVLSATVDLIDQGDPFIGWDNPEESGTRISSLYVDLSIGQIEVGINFGDMEHDAPVRVTLSSPAFSTKIVEFIFENEDGYFYFYEEGFDLDGVLATGGVADVTAVVAFS